MLKKILEKYQIVREQLIVSIVVVVVVVVVVVQASAMHGLKHPC